MKFRELRESRNMTQCELANAIGIKQNTISNWENGKYKPSIDDTIKIASVLKCTAQTVFDCFIDNL